MTPPAPAATTASATGEHVPGAEHAIVGAGIIGLTTAIELLAAGVSAESIAVVDPQPISGASAVAGGMLAPVAEVQYGQEALYPLMLRAAELWPALREAVATHSTLPTGYRAEATLIVAADRADATHLAELLEHQQRHDMTATRLTVRQARSLEPGLHPRLSAAVEIPGDHQVNPRLFCAAALDVLRTRGVRILPTRATALRNSGGRCVAVELADGTCLRVGSTVYACNGVGAAHLPGLPTLPIRPVRGDLLRLRVAPGRTAPVDRVIRGFVEDRPIYVIPRTDNTIAIGASTREDQRQGPAVDGVYTLLRDAIRIVPGLEDCEFIEALAGERPGTPDDLPLLGKAGGNIVISSGYFRHGILLSALGAKATAALGLASGNEEDARRDAEAACRLSLDACRWDRFKNHAVSRESTHGTASTAGTADTVAKKMFEHNARKDAHT